LHAASMMFACSASTVLPVAAAISDMLPAMKSAAEKAGSAG
jgi:hypothetical protein